MGKASDIMCCVPMTAPLTPAMQVAAHNYFRCRHGKNALTWQSSTYGHAKAWAATCTYAHSGPSGFENGGAGENLATSSYPQTHAPENVTDRAAVQRGNLGGGWRWLPPGDCLERRAVRGERRGRPGRPLHRDDLMICMIFRATTHLVSMLQRTRVIWGPTTHLVHSWSQAVQSNAIRI